MKKYLLFIALCMVSWDGVSFGQKEYTSTLHDYSPIDSLLVGNWKLHQIDDYRGYEIDADSNKFSSKPSYTVRMKLTTDSLLNFRDTALRFYYSNHNYAYTIEYHSLLKTKHLKLYTGKKKKKVERESYEILKCTIDELILRSYVHVNDGIYHNSFSRIYIFKREGIESSINQKLQGKWYWNACPNEQNSFLSADHDKTYSFSRSKDAAPCPDGNEHLELDFHQEEYHDLVSISSESAVTGLYIQSVYHIGLSMNLLYLGVKNQLVYNIDELTDEKLVLTLDKEKTKQMGSQK